jgi:hypothetical protein
MQVQSIKGIPFIEFETLVARKYRDKVSSCNNRNIQFSLSISQFRQLLMRKTCAYTGTPLTIHTQGNPGNTDLSIERIDNSKGYVKGNVIAVCYSANNIKSVFEDPNTFLSVNDAIRMFAKIGQLQSNM